MPTMTRINRPGQWRLLNALEFAEGGESNAARLLDTQDASMDDLASLNHLGLIQADVAGIAVVLGEHITGSALLAVNLAITPDGQRLVNFDPRNKVLRVFTILSPNRGGIPARSVQVMANVERDLLVAMNHDGLIEGVGANHEPIALNTFRKLPNMLRLRLTPRGWSYLPRH
jgi:hypothetical protein